MIKRFIWHLLLQPTMHYGNSCESRYPWIGRCEYDGAYELLEHIYGNLEVILYIVYLSSTIKKFSSF